MNSPNTTKQATPPDSPDSPAPSTPGSPSALPSTSTQRRVKYGLNVLVAALIVTCIVVLINVLSYQYLGQWRMDTTLSRKYSLSEQTRNIVGDLKNPYRIVALISRSNSHLDHAMDLISEYDHLSGQVTFERHNPNDSQSEKLYQTLLSRFENNLSPVKQLISKLKQDIGQAGQAIGQLGPVLDSLSQDPTMAQSQEKGQLLKQASSFLGRSQKQATQLAEQIKQQLDMPLPDYQLMIRSSKQWLTDIDQLLTQLTDQFFLPWSKDATVSNPAKDQLLQMVQTLGSLSGQLALPLSQISQTAVSEDYNQFRNQLGQGDIVLVMGPKDVRVLPMSSMFRAANQAASSAAGSNVPQTAEPIFIGEEQLTGSLVSMELPQKPLVVFITTGQMSALGPRGMYQQVASRLQTMKFDVRQWNVSGQSMMGMGGGQRMPPGPAPTPQEGQPVVWIVPPRPPVNPMNPASGAMEGQKIAAHVQASLDKGHGVLVFFSLNPGSQFGAVDPLAQIVSKWGIVPQTDRIILRRMAGPNRQESATPMHRKNTWPNESVMTQAITGMSGAFVQASPILLGEPSNDITHQTLVDVTGPDLWAATNLNSNELPKYDKSSAADMYRVIVASEKIGLASSATQNSTRLITSTDPAWATDQLTTYGLFGPGTASISGAAFPANSELFVNSVYWLAHLDQLIAASARSQDIRRIGPISPSTLTALQWGLPLTLPAMVFVAGIWVWMARQRA